VGTQGVPTDAGEGGPQKKAQQEQQSRKQAPASQPRQADQTLSLRFAARSQFGALVLVGSAACCAYARIFVQ
jgi:hypothetical protein